MELERIGNRLRLGEVEIYALHNKTSNKSMVKTTKNMICKKCDKVVDPVMKKSGLHLRADCPTCGYIKFVQQTEPGIHDVLPFGKHKGKTVEEILKADSAYAMWVAKEFDGRFGIAMRRAIAVDDFKPSVEVEE